MITPRKSAARGHAQFDWLDSRHSFSFGHYHDPAHMGFGALRVINEDRVAPAGGFAEHGHADMEIISYVLDGALAHRDSLGNVETIKAGEVQVMSAGTGVRHSEFNASRDKPVHFLQMWVVPDRRGYEPGYRQRAISPSETAGRLALVAAREGTKDALPIRQDAALYLSTLAAGQAVEHRLADGRRGWLQLARGRVTVNGIALEAGDGAAIERETVLAIHATEPSEIVLFDLA